MVRLLSLALRVLTLVEHVVREALEAAGESLQGLYAGNPKRETARPDHGTAVESVSWHHLEHCPAS
jgi:hypothetical protein